MRAKYFELWFQLRAIIVKFSDLPWYHYKCWAFGPTDNLCVDFRVFHSLLRAFLRIRRSGTKSFRRQMSSSFFSSSPDAALAFAFGEESLRRKCKIKMLNFDWRIRTWMLGVEHVIRLNLDILGWNVKVFHPRVLVVPKHYLSYGESHGYRWQGSTLASVDY